MQRPRFKIKGERNKKRGRMVEGMKRRRKDIR
jgi:hypothetical protein